MSDDNLATRLRFHADCQTELAKYYRNRAKGHSTHLSIEADEMAADLRLAADKLDAVAPPRGTRVLVKKSGVIMPDGYPDSGWYLLVPVPKDEQSVRQGQ